jgi:uncharacterized protein with HEPN domain
MQPESRKLLTDMLEASKAIMDFAHGKDFPDIGRDKLLRSGIYYQFVIIGEALSQLKNFDQSLFDRVSENARIVSFRNQVVHGYGAIRDDVTWQIIQDKVPVLHRELVGLLATQ